MEVHLETVSSLVDTALDISNDLCATGELIKKFNSDEVQMHFLIQTLNCLILVFKDQKLKTIDTPLGSIIFRTSPHVLPQNLEFKLITKKDNQSYYLVTKYNGFPLPHPESYVVYDGEDLSLNENFYKQEILCEKGGKCRCSEYHEAFKAGDTTVFYDYIDSDILYKKILAERK